MEKGIFDYREYLLDNGIQLVTVKKNTRLSSINVGIKIGSLFEDENEKGICHFIEHMLFKGTKNRDNNKINQDIEERAGFYSAYTDYISTVFSITALSEELESTTEILSDILINSTFPNEEIEKERGVILAEIRSSIDDIEQYSFNKIHEVAFKESPLRYDVIGSEKTIKSFDREQLYSFYRTYYIPNNCVICVVSPYSHEGVKEIVEKYFSNWSVGKAFENNIKTEKNQRIEKVTYKGDIEQSTLLYLFTYYGLTRKEEIALDILSHKLGESPNSILFRALREERGLAYDVYSQMDATEGVKTLYIYTAVGAEDILEAKNVIEDCIEKIKRKEIILDNRTVLTMKKVLKTSIASILEDSEGLGSYLLHQKIMGKKLNQFTHDIKILEEIKEEDIYSVAQKVLNGPAVHILIGKKQ